MADFSHADKLNNIFAKQLDLMKEYGLSPEQIRMSPFGNKDDLMQKIVYATIREVVEIGDELNWKWWKKKKKIDEEKLKFEIIDLLHFTIELAILGGLTAETMASYYEVKNAENFRRIHDDWLLSTQKENHDNSINRNLNSIQHSIHLNTVSDDKIKNKTRSKK